MTTDNDGRRTTERRDGLRMTTTDARRSKRRTDDDKTTGRTTDARRSKRRTDDGRRMLDALNYGRTPDAGHWTTTSTSLQVAQVHKYTSTSRAITNTSETTDVVIC